MQQVNTCVSVCVCALLLTHTRSSLQNVPLVTPVTWPTFDPNLTLTLSTQCVTQWLQRAPPTAAAPWTHPTWQWWVTIVTNRTPAGWQWTVNVCPLMSTRGCCDQTHRAELPLMSDFQNKSCITEITTDELKYTGIHWSYCQVTFPNVHLRVVMSSSMIFWLSPLTVSPLVSYLTGGAAEITKCSLWHTGGTETTQTQSCSP